MHRKFDNRELKVALEKDLEKYKAGEYKEAKEVLKLLKKSLGMHEVFCDQIHIKSIKNVDPHSQKLWRDVLRKLILDRKVKLEIYQHHKAELTESQKKERQCIKKEIEIYEKSLTEVQALRKEEGEDLAWFWTFLFKKFRVTLLFVFFILIAGAISYKTMPREVTPEVEIPAAMITTPWPGASAMDVEKLVTNKLETKIKSLENLDKYTSTSMSGLSRITVEFDIDSDLTENLNKLRTKIDEAKSELPDSLPVDPTITQFSVMDQAIISLVVSGDYSWSELKRFSETIETELEGVSKVKEVNVYGAPEDEVHILVDPLQLEARNIGLNEIANAIRAAHRDMPLGQVSIDGQKVEAKVSAQLEDIQEFMELPVAQKDGTLIKLQDVATIRREFAKFNVETYLTSPHETKPAILIDVMKSASKGNVIDMTEEVIDRVETLRENESLPDKEKLEVSVVYNMADYIRDSLSTLINSGGQTLILIFFAMWIALGFREAILSAIAIPLSLFIAFMALQAMGKTFNTMSLFAIVLAIGLLVDNAIIIAEGMSEGINERKFTPAEAAIFTVKNFRWPIIAGTLTTIFAFFPMLFFVTGVSGDYISILPISIMSVLLGALFVSIFLLPSLFIRLFQLSERAINNIFLSIFALLTMGLELFLLAILVIKPAIGNIASMAPPAEEVANGEGGIPWNNIVMGVVIFLVILALLFGLFLLNFYLWKIIGNALQKIGLFRLYNFLVQKRNDLIKSGKNWYGKGMNVVLRKFWVSVTVVTMSGLFFAGSIFLVITKAVPVETFPDEDVTHFTATVELPSGSLLSETRKLVKPISEVLESYLEGQDGQPPVMKNFVFRVGSGTEENILNLNINLTDKSERNIPSYQLIPLIQEDMESVIPAYADLEVSQQQGGPPSGAAPIEIRLQGEDIPHLEALANELKTALRKIKGTRDVRDSRAESVKQMTWTFDRDRLAKFGLSVSTIMESLRASVNGITVINLTEGDEEIDVNMRVDWTGDKKWDDPDSLDFLYKIPLKTPTGNFITLSQVAAPKLSAEMSQISHRDGSRVVSVLSDLEPGITADQLMGKINTAIEKLELRSGEEVSMGGDTDEAQRIMKEMGTSMLFALLLILIVLVWQFDSFLQAVIIMTIVFLSLPAVIYGFWFLRLIGEAMGSDHWIFRLTISVPTMIGIVALAGIIVNDSIVLIDRINQNFKEQGDRVKAFILAGKERLQPIFLTSLTTVLGMLPLSLSEEVWGSLGFAIVFGMSMSTVLTLLLVPSFLNFMNGMGHYFKKGTKKVVQKVKPKGV